jgi:hypothetical protein
MDSLGCEKHIQFLYQKMRWLGSGRLVIFSGGFCWWLPQSYPSHSWTNCITRAFAETFWYLIVEANVSQPQPVWFRHLPSGDGDLSPCNEEDEAQADGSTPLRDQKLGFNMEIYMVKGCRSSWPKCWQDRSLDAVWMVFGGSHSLDFLGLLKVTVDFSIS